MLVQVYGSEAVCRKCVCECLKRFRKGKETTEDEPRFGRPSTSRTPEMIDKVRQMLTQNRRLTLRLIAEELGIKRTRRTPSSAVICVSGRSSPDSAAQAHRRAGSKTDGNFWSLHFHVWPGSIASGKYRHER